MTGLPSKEFGRQIDFHDINKNIVDSNYLAMRKEDKIDTCVAFSTPIELIGVPTAGRLGNSEELKILLWLYNDNTILPDQEILTSSIKPFYAPETIIELKQMTPPDFKDKETIIEEKKKAEQQFTEFMKKLLTMVAQKEET